MRKLIFILLFFVLTTFVNAQSANSIYVNNLIGAGVNGYLMISGGALVWPSSYFTELKDSGFSSVRIVYPPATSNYHLTAISTASMNMLQGIVDECLAADLLPVIDFHYTTWAYYNSSDGAMLAYNMGQLSYHFRNYTYDQVVLELSNEPNSISVTDWNTLAANCVTAIRGYDADRVIMISPTSWGHIEGLSGFVLPNDDNIILSIHYYTPQWMVNQGVPWVGPFYGTPYVGTHWQNIQPMVDNLETEFEPLIDFQAANSNIPVNIGEWGTWNFADSLNRIKYATLLCRWFESKGWSHMVWEYDDYFGIKRRAPLTGYYPGLSEAITSTPLVLNEYDSTVIIEEDFNSVGTWSTYEAGGQVDISVSGGELVINVTATDGNEQHARVLTPTFDMYKDSIYRVTYTLRTYSGIKYLAHKYTDPDGYHPPYKIYIGSTNTTYCETYIMPIATQMANTFEFLVGVGTGIMYISDFKLEQLTVLPTVEEEEDDTCAYHITLYDTISAADSALWLFENNFTATYGTPTLTNHSTTFTSTAGQVCHGNYAIKSDIYQSWVESSEIELYDTFNISLYYVAWYTSGTILSNFGTSGSGFSLIRGGSNLHFITSNGVSDDTLSSNAVISNGTCFHIEIRARRSTGDAKFFIDGVDQTYGGDIITDFNLVSTWGIGANNAGGNQSWSYIDSLRYSTYYSDVTETDSCVMNVEDTLQATDTLFATLFDYYSGTYPYSEGFKCTSNDTALQLYEQEYYYYNNVNFTSENYMEYVISQSQTTNEIEVRVDSVDGQLLGYLNAVYTGGSCYSGVKIVDELTGLHRLYVVNNSPGETLYNIGYLRFYTLVPKNWVICNPFRFLSGWRF